MTVVAVFRAGEASEATGLLARSPYCVPCLRTCQLSSACRPSITGDAIKIKAHSWMLGVLSVMSGNLSICRSAADGC